MSGARGALWRSLVAVVVLAGLGLPALAAYTAHRLAIPARLPLTVSPADLGLTYEEAAFRARDGLTLRGWYLPARPFEASRSVILLHGENNHRADPYIDLLSLAADLVRSGYNVLAYDSRGHGQSEGDYRSFGDRERRDLKGAVDYLVARGTPGGWIGAIGFSLGAGTLLMTAPEEPRLRAMVADSGYADLRELIDGALPAASGLPAALTPLVVGTAKLFVGDIDAVKPERIVGAIAPRPLLIVHGTADETVPVSHARRLAAAYPGAEVWLLEGLGHVKARPSQPQAYLRRALATFARAGG